MQLFLYYLLLKYRVFNIYHNRVFDELSVTQSWDGDVLFLEDDHYLAPDALHILRLLRQATGRYDAKFLSLGNFNKARFLADEVSITDSFFGGVS